jgi:diaminopimelate decarboxylase
VSDIPARVVDALLATGSPRCAYVYDRTTLTEVARQVRAALPADAILLYAVTANGHPDVMAALATEVDGFGVTSGGELALARIARAGIGPASQIWFSGPAKTEVELAAAVEAGATVNIESATELRRLAVAAETAGVRVRVTLRTAQPGAWTGLDEAGRAEVVDLAWGHPAVRIVGLSVDASTDRGTALTWAVATAAELGVSLEQMHVCNAVDADTPLPAGVQLVVELGVALTAAAGWYAAEIIDLKRVHGRWFALLRGGSHHFALPAARGRSHSFDVVPVDAWHRPYQRTEITDTVVAAVGELGAPRDILTDGQPVARLRLGDLLVFDGAGAYGWDLSPRELGQHQPPDILITG